MMTEDPQWAGTDRVTGDRVAIDRVAMDGVAGEVSRRRRGRSLAIFLVLLALCLLFYAITIVKMARL